jgi:8-oxo-dGTP diphosphatase/2-hydroxy-dATP diphosphatase
MKKVRFGKGKWNGFGGHVEEGESIEQAAGRELKEEAGITAGVITKLGVVEFTYPQEDLGNLEVHVFRADDYEGEPSESDEMTPKWFALDEIPYHAMWPDDKYWLPLLLEGKKFHGKFVFDEHFSIVEGSAVEL